MRIGIIGAGFTGRAVARLGAAAGRRAMVWLGVSAQANIAEAAMGVKCDRRFLVSQAWWALGSLWLALVMWSFLNGPRLYAETVQETAREAALENQVACGRLNMSFGGEGYPVCASALDEVRRRQDERTEQRLNGPF